MKRTKVQWILSILLAIATAAMFAVGGWGYVTRSGEYAAERLDTMRTYAVMHAAATGIIDQIAKQAKDEAKDWATAKNEETGEVNIKGRDNQRDYYNAKEQEARVAAEAQYARFDGIDLSALKVEIPLMEKAEKAYFALEDQEKAMYADAYTQTDALAEARVGAWMTELEGRALTFAQLTDERLDAAKTAYAAIEDETAKAETSAALLQSATALAGAFSLEAPAADADGMDALSAVVSDAAEKEGEASEAVMEDITRQLSGLYGAHWVAKEEIEAQAAAFIAEATPRAAEIYTQAYGALPPEAEKGFAKAFKKQMETKLSEAQAADAASAEEAVSEDDIASDDAVKVDYSGFVGSAALKALQSDIDAEYAKLWSAMMTILPSLTEDMAEDQQSAIVRVVYAADESFEDAYAVYMESNAGAALSSDDAFRMSLANNAYNMILGAIALLVITLVALFYQTLVRRLGVPRLIIGVFFIMLLLLSGLYGLNMSSMMSNVLKRTGQYGILVLAMLPGIQCGISLNMGMTVGIVAGLLSTLIALECNMTGWPAFTFAVVVGAVFAAPIGWAYSKLLNKLKGNEMTVSTYVGFSFVSLMSIFWMILPFRNPKLTWALGTGLRVMHTMAGNIGGLLNDFLAFKVLGVTVPTGLLLFLFLCCFLLWLFSRSRTGTAMIAAGSNPRFAEAAGISVDKMRTIGTTLSTIVAAVGIIVYSQSFGFMQLYSGPRQMGFTAASAILIGGASTTRGKVSHVLIGTFLFQGVLSMGILVANQAISANGLSEVMRILISNGIILYALTQSGGEK